MTAALKFENISETTADISLSSVPRIRIKEDTVELNKAAGNDAADLSIATMKDVRSNQRMFEIIAHNGPLETIPVGTLPANGQKFYAAIYPEAAEALENGHQFIVSELLWSTGEVGNPDVYKGCFSLGGEDENGRWYRMPKWNADAGYRAPFLRGSEIGVDAGSITDDRIRNITGNTGDGGHDTTQPPTATVPTGAFALEGPFTMNGSHAAGTGVYYPRSFDASRVVPTGPENSPRYHGVIKCIRMFGTVSNPGSVDAAQLATDLAVANAKIASLETELENSVGFTIIYPNGGSEAAPANVSVNSRYVITHPFPGHHVICIAEIQVGGKWFASNWIYGGGGQGATAFDFDGVIVVQTGGTYLSNTANNIGHPNPLQTSNAYATPSPCRVKVWKVKGSAA